MQVSKAMTGPYGVNTYYVSCDNMKKGFIVDPGGYEPALTNHVKSEGVTIEYIILTHSHPDHTGGVAAFMKEFPEAKLVASKYEKEMLEDVGGGFFSQETALKPDLYVEDGDILNVGDLELKMIHTPGHSPGGLCVYVPAGKSLFSGDTLFRQSIGRTDFPGSSFPEIKKSIHEKLFVLPDDTQVFPGHMEETAIGFEKRNNPFV